MASTPSNDTSIAGRFRAIAGARYGAASADGDDGSMERSLFRQVLYMGYHFAVVRVKRVESESHERLVKSNGQYWYHHRKGGLLFDFRQAGD